MLWTVAWRNPWRHQGRSLFTAFPMASAISPCWATIAFVDGTYGLIFALHLVDKSFCVLAAAWPAWRIRRLVPVVALRQR